MRIKIKGTWKNTSREIVLIWEDGKITGEPELYGRMMASIADAYEDLRDVGVASEGKASATPLGFYLFCREELDNVEFLEGTEKAFEESLERIPEGAIG